MLHFNALELTFISAQGDRRNRVLGIVSTTQEEEEACVLLLSRRLESCLLIRDALPIYDDFQLSVSQSKPVDLDPGSSVSIQKSGVSLILYVDKIRVFYQIDIGR